jgi:hypothetical protein
LRDELLLLLYIDFSLFANSKIQLRLTKWSPLSCPLGGGRSIQLSYGDNYEISLILRGFLRSGQGPGLYSEAISIRRMAFLLMDFRPLKAIFEKLFLFPMLEKRLNHDAIRTKAQIFKNHLARDILFLRRRLLYPFNYGNKCRIFGLFSLFGHGDQLYELNHFRDESSDFLFRHFYMPLFKSDSLLPPF